MSGWSERSVEWAPAGYLWLQLISTRLYPASLTEEKCGIHFWAAHTAATPSLAKQISLKCWDWSMEALPLSQKKEVKCAPFFFPNSFYLATFLLSTTPPKPKGGERQQSSQLPFLQKKQVSVCARLCWAHSKGKELDAGWNLSESLRLPPRGLLGGFSPHSTSSPCHLGLVCEVRPWQHRGPTGTGTIPTVVNVHHAHACKHTFLMYALLLEYTSLLSKSTQIVLILHPRSLS